MADTLARLDALDEQIAQAWTDLLEARQAWAHSPNSDTLRVEEYAELRVNRLLERRHAAMASA